MPLLSITTNIDLPSAEQQSLLTQLSAETAALLGKPESYVMTHLCPSQAMSFAGSAEPCAYLELKSIGLAEERTADLSADLSAALCRSLAEKLAIPPERIYIEFSSAQRHLWGWDGRTF